MLYKKRNEIDSSIAKLSKGLDQLRRCNELVVEMQKELEELQPELAKKATLTDQLLVQIRKEQETVDGVKKEVQDEGAEVLRITEKTQALAEEAQKDLDEALPALDFAIKSLNSLNKSDISEIKSFAAPPPAVLTVMEAVMTLIQSKEAFSWASAKGVLNDPGFLTKLVNFDRDRIFIFW